MKLGIPIALFLAAAVASAQAAQTPTTVTPPSRVPSSGPTLPAPGSSALSLPAAARDPNYRLAPGDEIAISVRNMPDLSIIEAIRADGKIGYPVLREVGAAGLTVTELQARITQGLSRYIRRPDVTVVVQAYHEEDVFVVGSVRASGKVPFTQGLSAQEAINLAGGPSITADLQHVSVQRNHQVVANLDLSDPASRTVALQRDDVVVVPELTPAAVTVVGSVVRPGSQPLAPHEKVLDALTAAGVALPGVAAPASPGDQAGPRIGSDLTHVTLTRRQDTRPIDALALLQGNLADNLTLEAGDVLYVPPAAGITVVGAVLHPGQQSVAPGERLLDALTAAGLPVSSPGLASSPGTSGAAAAGGDVEPADLTRVVVTRAGQQQIIDFSAVQRGSMTDNILLEPGDIIYVPSGRGTVTALGEVDHPQAYRLTTGSRILDLLTLSGGLTPHADARHARLQHVNGTVQTIDLEALAAGKTPDQNVVLQDGDVLTVPVAGDQIAVLGQVAKPGVYQFKPGDDVLQALLLAGSAMPTASLSDVSLVRFNKTGQPDHIRVNVQEMVKSGKFDSDQRLQPGDIVFVSDKQQRGGLSGGALLQVLSYIPYLKLL